MSRVIKERKNKVKWNGEKQVKKCRESKRDIVKDYIQTRQLSLKRLRRNV